MLVEVQTTELEEKVFQALKTHSPKCRPFRIIVLAELLGITATTLRAAISGLRRKGLLAQTKWYWGAGTVSVRFFPQRTERLEDATT